MIFLEFLKKFPNEEACKMHFKLTREKEGVVCKRCRCTEHYWLNSKEMYQCKTCDRRMSLRSGTAMENSKLSFHAWYLAMYLMVFMKKNVSALEVQRQLGMRYYEPVWAMMHKIRRSMANRDDLHQPQGFIDLNLTILPVRSDNREGENSPKHKQRRMEVVVKAASIQTTGKKGKSNRFKCTHFHLQALEMKKATAPGDREPVNESPTKSAKSPAKTSKRNHQKFAKRYSNKKPKLSRKQEMQHWIQKILVNAKTNLRGIYHGVSRRYIQNYLSEFCYKLNRRGLKTNVFDRLCIAATTHWNAA